MSNSHFKLTDLTLKNYKEAGWLVGGTFVGAMLPVLFSLLIAWCIKDLRSHLTIAKFFEGGDIAIVSAGMTVTAFLVLWRQRDSGDSSRGRSGFPYLRPLNVFGLLALALSIAVWFITNISRGIANIEFDQNAIFSISITCVVIALLVAFVTASIDDYLSTSFSVEAHRGQELADLQQQWKNNKAGQ